MSFNKKAKKCKKKRGSFLRCESIVEIQLGEGKKGDENTKTNVNKYTSIQRQRQRQTPRFFGPNEINKRAESWLRQKHLVLANGDSAHSL